MYSLYRAWLSLGPSASLASGLPALPGTDIHSGPSAFGYSSQHTNGSPDVTLQVGPSMTHFSAHKSILSAHSGFFKAVLLNHTGAGPISVPNINVDEFSSLLTFMYTGYLDLNYSNIYSILLATHILHMPRALEICRAFLVQNHPLEAHASSSTGSSIIKPIPSRKSVPPHQQVFAPLFGSLHKSESTPFRAIGGPEKQEETENAKNGDSEAVPRAAAENNPRTPDQKKVPTTGEKAKTKKRDGGGGNDKVIIDVACCDGPVRFHRVLNKNYGLKDFENDFRVEPVDRSVLLNKIMNESIRDKQNEDENRTAGANDMFTCVYCNHTFKSQYCYQKHARRHLNPVNLEVKGIQKVENFISNKREVKLLDMNVQYYPCKTCGSKFPSYYFVHKHRKMCHADEVSDDNNRSGEETGARSNNNDATINTAEEAKTYQDSEIDVGPNN